MISQNRTKIIATLGPSSFKEDIINKMIDAGVDVFRINSSFIDYGISARAVKTIRKLALKKKQSIAILQDLQGPRIRLGKDLPKSGVVLEAGEKIKIGFGKYKPGFIPLDFKNFVKDVRKGTRVLLVDGLIELKIIEKKKTFCIAEVITGGKILPRKGVNIPNAKLSVSSLTKKDKEDLKWGMENEVDYIGLSFVQTAEDIKELRALIKKHDKKSKLKIIAKIENPKALRNMKSILRVSDAIMVARGDLGIEIPSEKLPVAQKEIILESLEQGKPVITATQMMESMISSPLPTRAESSDVANAILDGTDAMMLSGETAIGKFPVRNVDLMNRIIKETEREVFETKKLHFENIPELGVQEIRGGKFHVSPSYAIGDAVNLLSKGINAKYIVVSTLSGYSARMVSRSRPRSKILALCPDPQVVNQISLVWGVRSFEFPICTDTEDLIKDVGIFLKKNKLARKGDKVIIVCSHPLEKSGKTNLIKVEEL